MYFVSKPSEEAKTFIQAAGLTDETQMKAVGRLVLDLKEAMIWDKMKAVYPFVGQPGVSSSFQYNLKDPRNSNDAYRIAFTATGWIFGSTGVTPNGESAYANTFINSSGSFDFTSNHISTYGGDSNLSRVHYNIGAKDYFILEVGSYAMGINLGATPFKSGLSSNSGYFITTRTSLNLTKIFQNNTLLDTSTSTTTGVRDSAIIFGARNDGSFVSIVPVNYADGEIRFMSVGDGLTDTEAANFYTAVQRFQTTLGRQV